MAWVKILAAVSWSAMQVCSSAPCMLPLKPGIQQPKATPPGNIVDVGASANGQALPLVVGVLLVALEQGLDQRGVSGGVVGSVHLAGDGKAKLGKRCLCGGAAVLIVGADGYPAVKLALRQYR